jgi:CPA1 family monovalent cation:H+ antiporter
MTAFELALLLLGIVALVGTAARKLSLPYPILLVIAGLGLALVPGFPSIEPDPDLVLVVFLPPLLFAAAWTTPLRDVKRNRRPILLLSVGLVLFTAAVVGVVAAWVVPMSLAAAVTLGAIVSPPDALAATTILRRLAVPRRIVTILEGESLVNDATALVLYGAAVTATMTGVFVPLEAVARFAFVGAGSVVLGLVVAFPVAWLWRRLFDPPVEIALSLLIPYLAYLPAEQLDLSGVIAVVTAGLYLGRQSPRILASDARVLGFGVWQILTFLLNGFAFLLIGLSMPVVIAGLGLYSSGQLVGLAVVVSSAVVLSRFVWVYPATYLPRILVRSIRENDPAPPRQVPFVIAWAGMRGAVSLAAALALPLSFPDRSLIQFLAFVVILVTLVGQGLTLPLVLRRLGISADGQDARELSMARAAATEAGLAALDRLGGAWPDHRPLIERTAEDLRHRAAHDPGANGANGDGESDGDADAAESDERHEHLAILGVVIAAQRETVIQMRDAGEIGDDVLRRLERELDLEELRLQAGA